jgi:hypothetical protein
MKLGKTLLYFWENYCAKHYQIKQSKKASKTDCQEVWKQNARKKIMKKTTKKGKSFSTCKTMFVCLFVFWFLWTASYFQTS